MAYDPKTYQAPAWAQNLQGFDFRPVSTGSLDASLASNLLPNSPLAQYAPLNQHGEWDWSPEAVAQNQGLIPDGYKIGFNKLNNYGRSVLLDPQGNPVSSWEGPAHDSLRSDDYKFMAAVAAAGYGALGGWSGFAGGAGEAAGAGAAATGGSTAATGAAAFDPLAGYMTTGGVEGSIVGGGETIGGGLLGASQGAPSPLDEYLRSGASDMSTAGGQGGYAGSVGQDAGRELLGTFDPSAYQLPQYDGNAPMDTVNVNGSRVPVDVASQAEFAPPGGFGDVGGSMPPVNDLPAYNYEIPPMAEAAIPAIGAASGGGGLLDSIGGMKSVLPVLGAIAGSQGTPGATSTTQQIMDPRMQELLYGSGGLLGSAKDLYQANKSGVNANMQAGWDRQLSLLNDPGVASQLSAMRDRGGLLSGGAVASNPFATGASIPRNPFRRG